jgi:chromosomal replication initiator protein
MKDQFTLEDSEQSILLSSAWANVVQRMSGEVQDAIMARFIRPLTPLSFDGSHVKIAAPGRFLQEWVRERFSGMIQSYLSDELGQSISLEVTAKPREKTESSVQSHTVSAPIIEKPERFQPNEKYKFDNFVVGQSNRLAVAGAKAVANDPGTTYNPLFIYGPSGLGKTHLLHSIASEIVNNHPKTSIVYMTAQQFAEDFINALQSNKVEQFRRQHRHVSVWLLDDIQFIAKKDKTQEEVFHTFNYLHSLGKQIVVTSDRPPKDLHLFDERLRSRFESGLVADIQMPDTETRCAIIRSKAAAMNVNLNLAVAEYLAESVPGNIRILEGAITKMVTIASLNEQELSVELAKSLVDQYYQPSFTKPGFPQIVEIVSKQLNISIDEIKGPSRKAPVVHARHITIFLTRRITGDSWKHIGSMLGDRDHTSIMHGYQKIDDQMHHDNELLGQVKGFMRSLQSH